MTATAVRGDEVRVGDDLLLRTSHRVLHLVPYDASRLGIDDPGARIAYSTDNWCIMLFSSQMFQIERA